MIQDLSPIRRAHLATAIPFFTLIVAPLGVAGQNIGLGIGVLLFLILMASSGIRSLVHALKSSSSYLILWSLIVLPIVCATIARGDLKEASRFFWGYVLSSVMVIMGLSLREFPLSRRFLTWTVQVLIVILGLISLTQFMFGWKIEHGSILPQLKRAQGFYSHPLTLAYATLPIVPWITARFMANMRDPKNSITWLATMMIVAASQSVTVIVLTGVTIGFLAVKLLSRRAIFGFFVAALMGALIVVSVPNPIHDKFQAVLSGQRADRETGYPDDRLAFWHANWHMFLAAPWTGHGSGLEQNDRRPFYEQIKLGHIKRMYESHNMYLQYAVEGGVIAPLALLGFFVWWTVSLVQGLQTSTWHRFALIMTPTIFALGGLTQNAIQDSEVRYLLLLTCGASLWFTRQRPNPSS